MFLLVSSFFYFAYLSLLYSHYYISHFSPFSSQRPTVTGSPITLFNFLFVFAWSLQLLDCFSSGSNSPGKKINASFSDMTEALSHKHDSLLLHQNLRKKKKTKINAHTHKKKKSVSCSCQPRDILQILQITSRHA